MYAFLLTLEIVASLDLHAEHSAVRRFCFVVLYILPRNVHFVSVMINN